ncbi:MAG TPA: hypothetical protein VLO07_06840, partial [Thermoanaerobaculia bacterium]|nr:hypothetical protein [Thermoanaerobaculia bacterium]
RFGNYASRRASDVSLLTGELSPYREAIAKGESPLPVIQASLTASLKSLYRDGIGGGEGFSFGHLALFDRFSLALLLVGSLSGLVLLFRKTELLFVYLVIGAAFLAGVVLTIPPPAYHRFSIAFPFLVILMTLPFHLLLRLSRLANSVRLTVLLGVLFLFVCANERHLVEAVLRDQPAEELRLAELINQRFPNRALYVAAYRSFAFQKIFFFQDSSKNRRVESAYHRRLLRRLHQDERYVYVVIFPDEFRGRFEQADPNGRFFRFSSFYGVFAN